MATYFHGNSEIQGGGDGGLQTLILMNPAGYVGYSDTSPPPPPPAPAPAGTNFVFLNSNTTGTSNTLNLPHAPPSHTQQFVGFPLSAPNPSSSSSSPHGHHHHHQDISGLHAFLPRVHQYNFYTPSVDLGTAAAAAAAAARDVSRAQHGLSLSLSSSQQQQGYGGSSFRPESELPLVTNTAISPTSGGGGDDVRVVSGGSSSSASGISNGMQRSVLLSTKYLKAAQELLDEVVSVGKGATTKTGLLGHLNHESANKGGGGQVSVATTSDMAAASIGDNGKDSKRAADLTTAERQEIQMKKAKLVNMLDEVNNSSYTINHHFE